VSFQIEEGDIVGLLGPNGAGKTSILKMLSGILYPTDGFVEVAGNKPYLRSKDFKKTITLIVGQKSQMIWDLPGIDTLLWLKEVYEIDKDTFDINLKELTRIFQAEDLIRIQVRRLSLGQRMKMELIASMIHNPKIVFLDEPTIGLDLMSQHSFHEFLKEYNRKTNATIILTSHNLFDVEALCKKVILINNAKIVHDCSLDNLIFKYCDYKKIILHSLDGKVNSTSLMPGIELCFENNEKTVFNVKRDICKDAIKFLWSHYTFEDFTVEDTGIEEIIDRAFR
jgi:ABC-2 type transport system ATP-binding protein